jgi:hypothetical protein
MSEIRNVPDTESDRDRMWDADGSLSAVDGGFSGSTASFQEVLI